MSVGTSWPHSPPKTNAKNCEFNCESRGIVLYIHEGFWNMAQQ